jgi:hypothetical protein
VIYTIQSVYNNSRGGKDVTQAVVNSLRAEAAPGAVCFSDSSQELTVRGSTRPPHRVN